MRWMESTAKLPSDMPSLEDGMVQRPMSLQERVQNFCWKIRSRGSRNGNLIE